MKKEKIKSLWAKVGPRLLMLSGIVGVIDIPFTIMGWFPDSNNTVSAPATVSTEINYPTLEMYFNGKNISNGDNRELIICVDDTTQGETMDEIFPIFKNSTRHSAKDFKMIYTIKADSVTLSPKESDFNLSFDGEKTYTLKYSENILPAHFYIKEPIRKIKLNGEVAHLTMNTFITYDGTPKPYSYDAKTILLYIDSKGLESEEWIKECKRKIEKMTTSQKTDIFYSSNTFDKVYDYDMTINKNRKGFANQDLISVNYPRKIKDIRLLRYQRKIGGKDIDTLTLIIANGLRQDTTINTSIVIRNDSTGETEIQTRKVALNHRRDTVKFPIGKNYSYVNYKFESISGNNEISAKENNIVEDNIAEKSGNEKVSQNLTIRQISILFIMFVVSVFLFGLGLYLFRKNKRGKD